MILVPKGIWAVCPPATVRLSADYSGKWHRGIPNANSLGDKVKRPKKGSNLSPLNPL